LAIYAPAVNRTFFVYGGTTAADQRHLLCMVSYYDHASHRVPKPTIVYDKMGVNDPHDNPSLALDDKGHLWVFVSGRGRARPGFKFRSTEPYSIDAFEQITEEEMTYPQPHWIPGHGFLQLFTKYTGVRELYYETSPDGVTWSEDAKLAGIREPGLSRGGHYQVSDQSGTCVGTFFNRHPDGNLDHCGRHAPQPAPGDHGHPCLGGGLRLPGPERLHLRHGLHRRCPPCPPLCHQPGP
jgi:hypothetical protein